MTEIALIGVGDMGSAILPHLLGAGFAVAAFDTDASRLNAAAVAGARKANSPADAANTADIVFSLVMSKDVLEAHLGTRGVLAGLRPNATLVIGSTTTPDVVREVERKAAKGARLVDAPMVGGVRFAHERTLTFLAGGHEDALAQADPLLSCLGRVEHVGGFGLGVAYKLITNALVVAAEVGLREALDLTDLLGGDYDTALRLFGHGPMAAVVARALDESNPRPLRAAAEDLDTLLSVVADPSMLPISAAGRTRLWDAVNIEPGFEPMFVDITRPTTARSGFRRGEAGRR